MKNNSDTSGSPTYMWFKSQMKRRKDTVENIRRTNGQTFPTFCKKNTNLQIKETQKTISWINTKKKNQNTHI